VRNIDNVLTGRKYNGISANNPSAQIDGILPVDKTRNTTAKISCIISRPMATCPCFELYSPFSSKILTANTVLENCVIGPNVTLEQGSRVVDSTIKHAIVGRNAEISGSTVQHTLVGEGVTIRGETLERMVLAHDEAAVAR